MKYSSITGFTLINPNRQIGLWLKQMVTQVLVDGADYQKAVEHFKLRPDIAGWELFIRRVFSLLGVVLLVCGLIFFMAWNWESMPRFAKFALLEGVFIAFGAWAFLRWGKGWDARLALLGASMMTGALLALYGQVYQTGANAWELFRAWSIAALFIALLGRSTALWFLGWLTASLWVYFYIFALNSDWFDWLERDLVLEMALTQFAFLLIAECVHALFARLRIEFDPGRWLRRIIGGVAIILMACHTCWRVTLDVAGRLWQDSPVLLDSFIYPLYALSLVVVLWYYYKFSPELFFLALSIFSAAAVAGTAIFIRLIESWQGDYEIFLLIALTVLGLTFVSVKIVLGLRKKLNESSANLARKKEHHPKLLRQRHKQAGELLDWLDAGEILKRDQAEEFLSAAQAEEDTAEPWYTKLFSVIGIWVGSAALLGFITSGLMFLGEGGLGLLGIGFCAASVWLARSASFTGRQISHVLGLCSLFYAAMLAGFEVNSSLLLICTFLAIFWFFRPPLYSRAASFFGILFCLHWLITYNFGLDMFWDYYSYHNPAQGLIISGAAALRLLIFTLGCLYALYYFSRPPRQESTSRAQRKQGAALALSLYAALSLLLPLHAASQPYSYGGVVPYHLGLTLSLLATGGYLLKKHPDSWPVLLIAALPLLPAAWFMPVVGMGLCLIFIAHYAGSAQLLALSTLYLGYGLFMYYYSLSVTLLYKSVLLMGTGVILLALGRLAGIIFKKVTAGGSHVRA